MSEQVTNRSADAIRCQRTVVLALTVSAARRITAIEVIADPDRLRRLRLAVLPDTLSA